jgi:hypothetical protein
MGSSRDYLVPFLRGRKCQVYEQSPKRLKFRLARERASDARIGHIDFDFATLGADFCLELAIIYPKDRSLLADLPEDQIPGTTYWFETQQDYYRLAWLARIESLPISRERIPLVMDPILDQAEKSLLMIDRRLQRLTVH